MRTKEGFSLIEMIVYISILALMLIIVIEVVFSITRSQRVIKSVRNIENSALETLERIEREVRRAESINATSSIFGVHPGKLVLGNVEFYLSDGRLYLKENGVDTGALTAEDVTVTNLIFRRFATSTIEGIRAEITIESGTSTHYRIETFYSSAVVR